MNSSLAPSPVPSRVETDFLHSVKPQASLLALRKLMEGNQRFVRGLKSVENAPTPSRLRELSKAGQFPSTIILSCADSRVPSEIVFDQGLGDLFVLRVAGNVVAPSLLASIEFAAVNFGSSLIMVMGHTKCGAIKASIDHANSGKVAPSKNLEDLISRIRPVVEKNKKRFTKTDQIEAMIHRCTWDNVGQSIETILAESEIIQNLMSEGKIMIVGSVFDLDTGEVKLSEESRNA